MQQSDFSELRQAVCQIVAAVPRGRATSYGAVARALGRPGWARLVGRILGSCGEARIPAHRVVDSQGRLSGSHAFGSPSRFKNRKPLYPSTTTPFPFFRLCSTR